MEFVIFLGGVLFGIGAMIFLRAIIVRVVESVIDRRQDDKDTTI
ncbi:hypothetical protein [Campylobacter vicugnae]|uniref:Uncharacterized protein n=1 Tax=Campylobacter vicugnae TaxID=1660076 RepID=A0ABZ2E6J0_9BACT|nr:MULTISPECIES: hypothetical protein [unclassified Campylobacter]